MAHLRGDQPLLSIHNILKMLLSSNSSNKPTHDDAEMAEDVDEPPDQRMLRDSSIAIDEGLVYVKSPAVMNRNESLLTRALRTSPDNSPTDRHPTHDQHFYHGYPYHNVSGISTAELTSDGGMTSPSFSNPPSPTFPPQHHTSKPSLMPTKPNETAGESSVEANLGRRRCISFACGRKAAEQKEQSSNEEKQEKPEEKQPNTQDAKSEPAAPAPLKRQPTLTFVCPARDPETKKGRSVGSPASPRPRPRGSPAPVARKPTVEPDSTPPAPSPKESKKAAQAKSRGIPTSGLGEFEDSEATRFHEFASSVEEDDEWVKKAADYPQKITLSDCMKKEMAIRKLGEEAEAEALDEEDEEDDDDDDDDEEDAADDETVHDYSDDGNESDNEAGFAESDDSDDGSDNEFWAPSTTTPATSPQAFEISRRSIGRRHSNTSVESDNDGTQKLSPALSRKDGRKPIKQKARPSTPNLPDSTDFVCGTLDEDRPLEAAYKSCMEQRRKSKQVVIPQDIDPSFPTSDLDDNEDLEEGEEETIFRMVNDESARERSRETSRKASPRHSPKRMASPPPPSRRQGHSSPKRLRSPPPPMKIKTPPTLASMGHDSSLPTRGVHISGLVQRRPPVLRTKSLPRTPNPFFARYKESHPWSAFPALGESPELDSRFKDVHNRGPIDIVEGLEQKRQKRKEKFWRQHCRRVAKEQADRRPLPGKGAERMEKLGLEAAERCRGFGVGQDAQLVLSV